MTATIPEQSAYIREPRLPQPAEALAIGEQFGELDEVLSNVTYNLDALLEAWHTGKEKGMTFDEVGRFAVFADDLRLDVGNLRHHLETVEKTLDEALHQTRETELSSAA